MSVTCYNPLQEDIENISLRLLGSKNYLISKKEVRYYIYKYCTFKGYEDYSKYKENLLDFYDYIENYLNIKTPYSEEFSLILDELKENNPDIQGEISSNIINLVLESMNTLVEDDFKFHAVPLENGNYKIAFYNKYSLENSEKEFSTDSLSEYNMSSSSIRYNKELNKDLNTLSYISKNLKKRGYYTWEENSHTIHKIINNYYGNYYLSQLNPQQARLELEKFREKTRLPKGLFDYKIKGKGIEVVLNNNLLQDAIKESDEVFKVGDSFDKNIFKDVVDILKFLSAKTGMKYKIVSKKEALELLNTDLKNLRTTNAFVIGNVCYFIKGKNLTADIAAEEMLHPLVNAIKLNNENLYGNLLNEAKELFPKLHLQIKEAYKSRSVQELEEELVTQSISRAFRVERKENPRGRKLVDFINKFIQSIRELFVGNFGGLFNRDYVRTEEITKNTSIFDLVKIINSDIEILYENSNIIRFSKNSSIEDITNNFIEILYTNSKDNIDTSVYDKFDAFIERTKSKVKLHTDFENNHIYLINNLVVDTSVTQFIKDPKARNKKSDIKYAINKEINTAQAVGLVVDEIVRNFFSGKKMPANSINMPKNAYKNLINDLEKFKSCLDKTFPKGYKIYSEEINLSGIITTLNKKGTPEEITIVGTPDLILVTPEGKVYIIDLKTSSNNNISKDSLLNYSKQIKLYQLLMFSDLNTKDKGTFTYGGGFILLCNVDYIENTNFTKNNKGEYISEDNNSLKNYLQNTNEPFLVNHKDTSIGYLLDADNDIQFSIETILQALSTVNSSKEELKEIAKEVGIPEKVIENEIKKSKRVVNKVQKSTTESVTRSFPITLENSPISASELSKIGKDLVKTFSYAISIISKQPEFLKYLKVNIEDVTGWPTDKIIREHFQDLKTPILNYIKKAFFQTDHLDNTSPEYIKFKYVKLNIESIFNRSFAEFREVEHINIKIGNIDGNVKMENTDILENLEEDGRESYFIDSKEKNYIETIPSRLKRELALIPDIAKNSEGNPIIENGMPKLIISKETMLPRFQEKTEVINTLFEDLHSYRNILDMMEYLKISSDNWKNYLYNRMKDDPKLQTIFYRTFRKNKTNYYNTSNNKNRKISFLEDKSTKAFYMDSVYSYENSLLEGIKFKIGVFKEATPTGDIKVNISQIQKFKQELSTNKKTITSTFSLKSQLKKLQLPEFKIPLHSDDKVIIINALETFYNSILREAVDSGEDVIPLKTFELLYNNLINFLLPYTIKSHELMVYDQGKSYAAYTEPTFILDTVEDFSLGRWKNFPQGNKDNWQFFIEHTPINSWYALYKNSPSKLKAMKHLKKTSSNGIAYADLSSHLYLRSIILDYFCSSLEGFYHPNLDSENLAIFRVPIESDKPSQESILFYKIATINKNRKRNNYDVDKMKKSIAKYAFMYFLQELIRMGKILSNPKDSISKISRYDLNVNNPIVREINNKIKNKSLTIKDFLNNEGQLHSVLQDSGVPFAFLSELNAEIFNNNSTNDKLKEYIILYIQEEGLEDSESAREFHELFESLFIKIMDTNYNKFISDYFNPANEDSEYSKKIYDSELGDFILEKRDFMKDIVPGDTDALKNAYLQEFFYNDYLATLNILNMTVVDPAFFKNTIDLQKRFAQVHSSTVKPDINAKFRTSDGYKLYSQDGNHRVLILKDFVKKSDLKNEILKILNKKLKDSLALYQKEKTEETALKINLYNSIIKEVDKLYNQEIVTTDGQAFSTPTGAWKKRGMLGEDSVDTFKYALEAIRNKNFESLKYFTEMSQVFKSFTASIIQDPGDPTLYKPILFKDSEAMLLAIEIMKQENNTHPLVAVYEFLENSHYNSTDHNDNTYNGIGIDLVVFESAVKESSSYALDLTNMDYNLAKKALNTYGYKYIHKHSFDNWGQQQHVPQHYYEDSVDLGSQVRILPVADLPEDFTIPLNIQGKPKTLNKRNFLQYYMNLLQEDFREGIEKVKETFNLELSDVEQSKALKQLLLDSIMKDSNQNIIALDIANNHNHESSMIGDPSVANKVYSTIFTKIKKEVNKLNFLGGSAVLVADINSNSELHVRDSLGRTHLDKDFDLSKGAVMDIAIIPSDRTLYSNIIYDKSRHDKKLKNAGIEYNYKPGDIMKVDDLLTLGIVTEEDLQILAYRIPTEDKYSIFRCRIVEFLPLNSGELIILPNEGVLLSGFDYDIDKLYIIKRYKNPKEESKQRKNDIFNCLWEVLGHPSSIEKQFHPGDFSVLSNLAKVLNPTASKVGNIANITTLIELHRSNTAGKKFVGIAALNNISHAISNIALLKIKPLSNVYKIKGKQTDFFNTEDGFLADSIYSFIDGSRISRTLGMFVGASADNAKEAVLGKLNITPTTANLSMAMIRMGIPIDIIAGIMNLPEIKEMSINKSSFQFHEELLGYDVDDINTADIDITFEDLLDMAQGNSNSQVLNAVITLLQEVHYISLGYNRLNNITSLNSTKNSVGPTPFEVYKKSMQIDRFDLEYDLSDNSLGVFTNSLRDLYDSVPFLKPLKECYLELVPEICKNWSPVFTKEFKEITDILFKDSYIPIEAFTPDLFKTVVNSFLIYNSILKLNINNEDLFKNFFKDIINYKKDENREPNLFIDRLLILTIKNSESFKEVILRVSNLNMADKEDIAAAWEDLSVKNPELSNKLLSYFIITQGFYWTPISPITLGTYRTKQTLENYNEIFTNFEDYNRLRFLILLLGNLTVFKKIWTPLTVNYLKIQQTTNKNTYKDFLTDSSKIKINKNEISANINYITIENDFYVKFEDEGDSFIFIKIPPLGIQNKFYEFNPFKDLLESSLKVEDRLDEEAQLEEQEKDPKDVLEDRIELVTKKQVKKYKEEVQKDSKMTIDQYFEDNRDKLKAIITKLYNNLDIEYTENQIENTLNSMKDKIDKYCI